jgi:hypothetical protein
MFLLFGGSFCVALVVGIMLPNVFAKFIPGKRGAWNPMITLLLLTGLPTALFLRELLRSWRSYQAIFNGNTYVDKDNCAKKNKESHRQQ